MSRASAARAASCCAAAAALHQTRTVVESSISMRSTVAGARLPRAGSAVPDGAGSVYRQRGKAVQPVKTPKRPSRRASAEPHRGQLPASVVAMVVATVASSVLVDSVLVGGSSKYLLRFS